MGVLKFENNRWGKGLQTRVFRHDACLELIKKGTVLDLGCGDGLLLDLLSKKGFQGEGLDISDISVRICQKKGIKATKHSFDTPLPYPDDSFDNVIVLDVLEHLYEPSFLLREATRVSRMNVIVGVPNFSSLPARIQMLFGKVPENNKPNKGHIYWFNYDILIKLAKPIGLIPVECKLNTFKPFSYINLFFTKISPNLMALSYVIKFNINIASIK